MDTDKTKEILANSSSSNGSDDGQSKTLIANCYSSDGTGDPDPYKKLDDWSLDEEEINLAYRVTKGGRTGQTGLVRVAASSIADSGSHEEWYSGLQVNLAHYFGAIMQGDLPNGEEPEGPVPLMEFLMFDGGDVMDFLRENPDQIQHLNSEELAELKEEYEEEQAEASADD